MYQVLVVHKAGEARISCIKIPTPYSLYIYGEIQHDIVFFLPTLQYKLLSLSKDSLCLLQNCEYS